MSNISIKKNRNNDTLLQEIKNYLFGKKNKKELNYYTVLDFKDKDDFTEKCNNFNHNVKDYLLSSHKKKAKRQLKAQLKIELEDIQSKKGRKKLKGDIEEKALKTSKIIDSEIRKKGLQYIIDLENKVISCNLDETGSNNKVAVLQRNNNKPSNESYRDNALNYLSSLEEYLNIELSAINLDSLPQSEQDRLEEEFQKFNEKKQFSEKVIHDSIKEGGLHDAIRLKKQILSYQQEFEKEKESEKEKNRDNLNKVDESYSKILGNDQKKIALWHKFNLDYISQVKNHLGFNLECPLEETIEGCFLMKHKDKLERKFGKEIKKFNRESAAKILSDSSLRLIYDEGVASKELSPLASYEDCVKYQQKVNERDSSVGKSEAIVEEANNQQQIDLKNEPLPKLTYEEKVVGSGESECIDEGSSTGITIQLSTEVELQKKFNDREAEKASVVKHVDISYSPTINVNAPKPKKVFSITQSLKKAQVVQNLDSNTMSNLHIVQKQKRLSFSNTMTLLLSIYGRPISSIFGMKNFQTSFIIRFNWPNLNVNTEISNIKALESPQEKLTSETSQNVQQQDNKEESNNSFSTFSNIKNWCYYNIVEPVVNFVGVTLEYNALNSNLNTDYKSDIEPGISGRYTKTPDNITSSVSNELHGVTIHKLLTTIKCIG
ncbi:hypothetical protein [Candidatus Mesenet endosymbiont of Phosphuga atrata]|uniref:hypothetical protein n=1 Tax=Candidatus Mesenet endosymbiont of Phosphuga atrata TaxID=3066221 RepID=UPI0030D2D9A6